MAVVVYMVEAEVVVVQHVLMSLPVQNQMLKMMISLRVLMRVQIRQMKKMPVVTLLTRLNQAPLMCLVSLEL